MLNDEYKQTETRQSKAKQKSKVIDVWGYVWMLASVLAILFSTCLSLFLPSV